MPLAGEYSNAAYIHRVAIQCVAIASECADPEIRAKLYALAQRYQRMSGRSAARQAQINSSQAGPLHMPRTEFLSVRLGGS